MINPDEEVSSPHFYLDFYHALNYVIIYSDKVF